MLAVKIIDCTKVDEVFVFFPHILLNLVNVVMLGRLTALW